MAERKLVCMTRIERIAGKFPHYGSAYCDGLWAMDDTDEARAHLAEKLRGAPDGATRYDLERLGGDVLRINFWGPRVVVS